jgi:hypothetical protein
MLGTSSTSRRLSHRSPPSRLALTMVGALATHRRLGETSRLAAPIVCSR